MYVSSSLPVPLSLGTVRQSPKAVDVLSGEDDSMALQSAAAEACAGGAAIDWKSTFRHA
jgi:hypothetical protein